jgi:hypothetical protein
MDDVTIRIGGKYRCIDDKGNERFRTVEAIDRQEYIPPEDRKVHYTDERFKELGSLYTRTFRRQVVEVLA